MVERRSAGKPRGKRRASFGWSIWVFALAIGGGAFGQQPDPSTVLARYVAEEDPSYAWRVRARYEPRGATVIELTLDSQTWRGGLWKHQLLLIKPDRVTHSEHAVLIIGGGRWREAYESQPPADVLPEDGDVFVAIARRLQAVVAVVGQVPFQPLFDLTEDRLIAYTFDQYLRTGDPSWPLLLPMVKSAVRAMDASQEAASAEWGLQIQDFTVLGGSKRGWTTWLTAAVEPRVSLLVPAVIDALNMERHFPYQSEVWGAPSEEILPYTELGLHTVLGSAQGDALRRIVDPFTYRASIAQPKLVVLATNDSYFPVDSANLYWDALSEPKYLLYLPNEEHSIDDYSSLVRTLRGLRNAAAAGSPLPRVAWEFDADGEAVTLCVRAERNAAVRLWSAASEDRDFRDAVWSSGSWQRALRPVFVLARPRQGYAATFAEARLGAGRSAFTLSTNLAVLAATPEQDGPRSIGSAGVCDGS